MKTKQILLIEDDHLTTRVARQQLEDVGYEVTHCATVDQIRQIPAKTKFEVILLDMIIPGAKGLDLFDLVHLRFRGPIAVVTGLDNPVLAREVSARGAAEYVVKQASPKGVDWVGTARNAIRFDSLRMMLV